MARAPKVIADEIDQDMKELLDTARVEPKAKVEVKAEPKVEAPVEPKVEPKVTPRVTRFTTIAEAPAPVVVEAQPLLSAKTLAEMEGGRQAIARYKK